MVDVRRVRPTTGLEPREEPASESNSRRDSAGSRPLCCASRRQDPGQPATTATWWRRAWLGVGGSRGGGGVTGEVSLVAGWRRPAETGDGEDGRLWPGRKMGVAYRKRGGKGGPVPRGEGRRRRCEGGRQRRRPGQNEKKVGGRTSRRPPGDQGQVATETKQRRREAMHAPRQEPPNARCILRSLAHACQTDTCFSQPQSPPQLL